VNNWGSLAEHLEPRWQALRDAALEACHDYEGSRSFRRPPGPLCFSQAFDWGNAGFFVLDVRAERRQDGDGGQIVGEAQIAALDAFLAARAHLDALFVVVPVPLVHIPDWMTAVGEPLIEGEVDDRWSQPRFAPSRDRLLERVAAHARRHPRQRIALLSGDIHAGWAIGLRDEPPAGAGAPAADGRAAPPVEEGRPLFYQFVSSAMTNQDSCLAGALSKALIKITGPLLGSVGGFRVGPLCGAEQGKNPYGGLNVGLVELERREGEVTIRFKIVSHEGAGVARPVVVFDSGPL
jgi:hypothetical protein